jgi:ribonuclease D
VQALAAWREATARENDIPRSRVLKDESLTEISAHTPVSTDDLMGLRAIKRDRVGDDRALEIICVLDRVRAMGNEELPEPPPERPYSSDNGASTELLKVLLKLKCDSHKVAQKLVATSGDIEAIAADDNAEVRALAGWRRDVFGEDALRLKHGQLALTAEGSRIKIIEIPE